MKTTLAYLCSSSGWGGLEMNHLKNALWMHERGYSVVLIGGEKTPFHQHAMENHLAYEVLPAYRKHYPLFAAQRLKKILLRTQATHLLIRSTRDLSIGARVRYLLGNRIQTAYFTEMQIGIQKTSPLHNLRYKYIDLWSCPLEWLAKQVREKTNFKNTLKVIPSGLDLSHFDSLPSKAEARKALDLPEQGFLFGIIGRFDAKKGQLLLLEALEKVSLPISVVLVGEPTQGERKPYFSKILDFIREHHLEKQVFLRPFQGNPYVAFRALDWSVMASDAETFGMDTIESMACGTTVLGSNAGGTPEIIRQSSGGVLFTPKSADDLAHKIKLIVQQNLRFNPSDLREKMNLYDHHTVCTKVEGALKL